MSETRKERVDRELIELLNELRVALPGVQVLFAFLLTVPFSSRFEALSSGQRMLYFLTFATTVAASACLMAPTTYHRLRFRDGDKERMLVTANRFAIVGTALMAIAIGLAMGLVADLLYGITIATVAAASVIGLLAWSWFGIPLFRKFVEEPEG